MVRSVDISIEQPKRLSASLEIALLRRGLERQPCSAALTKRLVRLLNQSDAFDDAIALLDGNPVVARDLGAQLALATACFAKQSPAMDRQACEVVSKAAELAGSDAEQAMVLAELAKAKLRLGATADALGLLHEALRLDPGNVPAFKRLATELLRTGQPEAVADLTETMIVSGVRHARVLALRSLSLAGCGRVDEARALPNLSENLHAAMVLPPPSAPDLDAFNLALATEIMANPDLRFERAGTSSVRAWRVDDPAIGAPPMVSALLALVVARINAHLATLNETDHPWLAAKPERAELQSWCVIAETDGFEQWHMHPGGWLSGGYYVEVPEAVATGSDTAGCLMFGLPGGMIGEEAAASFGTMLIRPVPGLLTLFPSHAYHRTFPHGGSGRRMCIAFDLRPL